MSDTDALVVYCTVGDGREGERLARTLVARKLAACVNVLGGVRSYYWWEGQVQADDELLLIAKTDRARFEGLVEAILQEHSYDCPEVVATPVTAGAPDYLDWIRDALERPD
ncbi:MAG: divalent-cation tolerance protein CutA [Acidobacteriota bacterium]